MYRTLEEYHSLMLEAKVEYDEWERTQRQKKKEKTLKHKALRLAKLEARAAYSDY